MAEEEFEHHVELLDILVRDFVSAEADFLSRLVRREQEAAESDTPLPPGPGTLPQGQAVHPQVLKAIDYIQEHLSDPKLTIARIAFALDIHPDYLGHLFAAQVGQRMGQFIIAKRVELAKTLLATTDWQIKRIAYETGYANPNWFCHVFIVHTGLTPGECRKESRRSSRCVTGR
jgi:AraC-like DNA-binding protein